MLIKKSNTTQKSNWETCKVREYEFETNDFWVAKALITWRYPEQGTAMNTTCDQVYYILSWKWIIHSDAKWSFEVSQWDSYWFEKNERYSVLWEDLEVLITNAPAWSFDQYVLSE